RCTRRSVSRSARASVAVRKFARVLSLRRSELPNQGDTSNFMILVSLLDPKFAKVPAEQSCGLRVRGTRASLRTLSKTLWHRRIEALGPAFIRHAPAGFGVAAVDL